MTTAAPFFSERLLVTGAKALGAMAARVSQARETMVEPSVWKPAVKQQEAIRAAICPVCAKRADFIGRLQLVAAAVRPQLPRRNRSHAHHPGDPDRSRHVRRGTLTPAMFFLR